MDLLSSLNPNSGRCRARRWRAADPRRRGLGEDARDRASHRLSGLGGHRASRRGLAVTFTNKAAEEMRDARREAARQRLPHDVDLDVPRAVRAAAAPRSAQHRPVAATSPSTTPPISSPSSSSCCKEYRLDDATYQPRMVLGRISHAKNRMEGPETLRRRPGTRATGRSAGSTRAT